MGGAPNDNETDRLVRRLEAIARRTGNAVIATDVHGVIEWVNQGFERLTGYTAAEALGRHPGALLQGSDTDPDARARMSAAVAAGAPFEEIVLNYKKDGRQYWVRIEAEPTNDADGAHTGYIALETDVTEERIGASFELLTKRVGDLLLASASVLDAAQRVVSALVETSDIRAAEVWLVRPGRPTLEFLAAACASPEGQAWVDATAANAFAPGTEWVVGVGAPGVAWGTGAPCQKTDFWERDALGNYSRRAQAARAAGIRTVCAVPVLGASGVLAVLEFGGSHAYPGHERLPGLVERIARQFGAFIAQIHSQRAFEALFRESPDALLVVDLAGTVTQGNARANALFGAVTGRSVSTLFMHPEPLDAVALSGDDLQELTGVRADGSTFVASLSISRGTGAAAIVAVRDLTDRRRAEEMLRRSLQEKVTLVQEVHHRVKNNLQVLSSLVAMQADDMDDPNVRRALDDTVHRIRSIALVHAQLYAHDDLSRIGFDEYARSLCVALNASAASDAEVVVDADLVTVELDRAIPAGLILNELVTNAFKYGASADGRTRVRISVRAGEDGGFSFEVADDGRGFDSSVTRPGSMGSTLIRALARQLRATVRRHLGPGARVAIDVPGGKMATAP
jgi:PAS domain S-box-containing protein